MSGSLKIREDVVQSCIQDGHKSINMLSVSTYFTDAMAEAAGPNGPLRGTLERVEDAWRLRRAKILEILENLVQNITDINKGFTEVDEQLGSDLSGRGDAPITSGGGASDEGPAPSGAGGNRDTAAGSGGSTGPAQTGGSATAPMPGVTPMPQTPPAHGGSEPVPPAAPVIPPSSEPVSGPSTVQQRLNEFVEYWARVTGMPVEKVWQIVAAVGVGGLIGVGAIGPRLGHPGRPGPFDPVEGHKVDPSDGETSEGPTDEGTQMPSQDGQSDGTSNDGSAPADPDGATDGLPPLTDESDVAAEAVQDDPPLDGADQSEVYPDADSSSPGDQVPAGEVPDEVAKDLAPESSQPPVEGTGSGAEALPDLTPLDSGTEASDGGATPADLPPLTELDSGDVPTASTSEGGADPVDLPDLVETPASPPRSPGQPDVELPDLATPEQSEVPRAAMPMGAGGMGVAGMGAGHGAAASGGGVPSASSGDRQSLRRDAKDVLVEAEKGRES